MNTPDYEDYRWLTGAEATRLLLAAQNLDPLAAVTRLRRDVSPSRAGLAAQQLDLRRRAARKFCHASSMLFTSVGVQQATGDAVAAYKAARFANRHTVADLCCGIGGDLIGLARRPLDHGRVGNTIGVDRDRILATVAGFNARVCRVGAATQCRDVCEFDIGPFDAWHIDPDRRAGGNRTTDVARYSPNLPSLSALLAINGNAAVKLAPGIEVPPEWRGRAEMEWISHDRECRQAVAWFGDLRVSPADRPTGAEWRRATRVARDGQASSFVGVPDQPLESTTAVGRYVYEPDPAVLAAGLAGDMARHHQLAAFATTGGYLTSDLQIAEPLLTRFAVTDVLPFDLRKIKRLLQDRGVGRVTVKQRGVDIDPGRIQRQLKSKGRGAVTLLVANMQGSTTAIISAA